MSAVIGIVFNANKDQVLILKRRDVAVWVFPGGGIDPGETPEAAVQREVLEETGFHVSVVKKVGEYSPLNRLSRYTYVFECHLISGQAMIGAETREIRFHPLNSLPKTFFFIHYDWLQDALKNQPLLILKPIHQVTYLNLFKYFLLHPIQVVRITLSRFGFPINN